MEINDKIELTYKIKSEDLAKSLSLDDRDDFPEVFATSRMVALMELAASRLIRPLLKIGQLSVGVNVNVNHTAATPNHQEIKIVAEFKGMEDKLFLFEVSLYDSAGKAGSGTHTRAIIDTDRLEKSAINRVKK
ncbi:hypothetical protein [Desulfobacula sp.]|uniref:thioesterase family protein n=1 Tax=Desulfobacula sp. TaxID=2593537 RepID=UPI0026125092|nr:hypothetical protein [Desulfobacula sp.]